MLIASRVSIPSGARQHDASSQSPCIPDSTPRLQRVHIGSNVWIGEGAIILADVDTRCIIGAGAVVTRTIPSGATVVGNPAKVHSRYPAAQPDGGEPTEATTTDSARDAAVITRLFKRAKCRKQPLPTEQRTEFTRGHRGTESAGSGFTPSTIRKSLRSM